MNSVHVLATIDLFPVVEICPYRLASPELLSQYESPWRSDEERQEFWRRAFAERGFDGIGQLIHGTWLVATNEFQSVANVRSLLEALYHDSGGPLELLNEDRRAPLVGGFVLRSNQIQILPTCCADLGDRQNWYEASRLSTPHWQTLWIGHPWLMMKYESPWLILSDYCERDVPVERWAIDPIELQRALGQCDRELERLAVLVQEALPPSDPDLDRVEVARYLVGLPS